jgi:hypothetical protein
MQVLDALQGTNDQLRTVISTNMEAVETLLYNGTVLLARSVLTQLDTISNRLQAGSEDGYRQLEAVRCHRLPAARLPAPVVALPCPGDAASVARNAGCTTHA